MQNMTNWYDPILTLCHLLQLLETLRTYADFEINDQTGEALTLHDRIELHYNQVLALQVYDVNHFHHSHTQHSIFVWHCSYLYINHYFQACLSARVRQGGGGLGSSLDECSESLTAMSVSSEPHSFHVLVSFHCGKGFDGQLFYLDVSVQVLPTSYCTNMCLHSHHCVANNSLKQISISALTFSEMKIQENIQKHSIFIPMGIGVNL